MRGDINIKDGAPRLCTQKPTRLCTRKNTVVHADAAADDDDAHDDDDDAVSAGQQER